MENRFGMPKKRKFIEENYKGKYVVMHTQTKSFSGKISELLDDSIILKPHQGYEYLNEDEYEVKMVDEPGLVRLMDVMGIFTLSEESLKNYCKYSNKHQEPVKDINGKNPKE